MSPRRFVLAAPLAEPAKSTPTPTNERVVYEKMPDGSIRKTTITTKVVPMPAPPPRPADPYPADPLLAGKRGSPPTWSA